MDSSKEPFQLLLACEDKNEYEVKHRDLSTGIFILKNVISKEDIHQIKNAIDEYAFALVAVAPVGATKVLIYRFHEVVGEISPMLVFVSDEPFGHLINDTPTVPPATVLLVYNDRVITLPPALSANISEPSILCSTLE